MKAAILYAPFDMRLEETPAPSPAAGEVLIEVKAAGICGGDLHFFTGHHPYRNYPRIHGHELAGRVAEVGAGVTGLARGGRVVLEPMLPCRHCYPCGIGRYNCCENLRVVGAHVDGAFAQYLAADAEFVHRVPDSIPDHHAAAIEPYTIAAHCLNRAGARAGEKILVLGCGAIGLCIVDLAKCLGAEVIAADLSRYRLDIAGRMGADRLLLSSECDLEKAVAGMTGGSGVPVVMEATGSTRVMEMTQRLVACAGRVVIVGLTNDNVSFAGINFTKREMSVLGSRNSVGDFPGVIGKMAAGKLHPAELVTHRRPFDRIVETMREAAEDNSAMGKIVLEL